MNRGRQRAIAAGLQRPNFAHQIHYGLLAQAELNPLTLRREPERRALIKTVLFNVESSASVTADELKYIRDRLAIAFNRHLPDSAEDFNKWFWGAKNSLVKQIAKQRRALGGELDGDVVRDALVELGWEAYPSVARCVAVFMKEFQKAVTPRLGAIESRIFEGVYLPHKMFGGLPFLMLAERMEFVQGFVWQFVEQAEHRKVDVLYRLLSFYSAMIDRRRRADKVAKARSGRRTEVLDEHSRASAQRD